MAPRLLHLVLVIVVYETARTLLGWGWRSWSLSSEITHKPSSSSSSSSSDVNVHSKHSLNTSHTSRTPSSSNTPSTSSTFSGKKRPVARFVPFPHKPLPLGRAASCNWEARDPDNFNDPVVASMLGSQEDRQHPDLVQTSVLKDSFCRYNNQTQSQQPPIHIFSAAEARQCLVDSNVTVTVSGESYTIQLFLGLTEILLGQRSTYEIRKAKNRRKQLRLQLNRLKSQGLDKNLDFICMEQCYGEVRPFSQVCGECHLMYREKIAKSAHPMTVVNVIASGIHILHAEQNNVTTTMNELYNLVDQLGQSILVSGPKYQTSLVPAPYKRGNKKVEKLYWEFLRSPLMKKQAAAEEDPAVMKVRYLDVFQLAGTCVMKNCSVDGGHRSRFVNRWKAQLLLNTLCMYEHDG